MKIYLAVHSNSVLKKVEVEHIDGLDNVLVYEEGEKFACWIWHSTGAGFVRGIRETLAKLDNVREACLDQSRCADCEHKFKCWTGEREKINAIT